MNDDRQVEDRFVVLLTDTSKPRSQLLAELPNSDLRQRVEELLTAHEEACRKNWLEHSPLEGQDEDDETQLMRSSDTSEQPTGGEVELTIGIDDPQLLPSAIGRYRIIEPLGGGGDAQVFLAHDPNLGANVALKVPHRRILSPRDRDRFLMEAHHLFGLSHPNIVRVFNADVLPDGRAYIAMEYVEGTTFADHLRQRGPLTIQEAAGIMIPVCQAIAEAHARELIHRDLKPANILLTQAQTPKVSDFGMAIQGNLPRAAGEYAGTLPYMSPEQVALKSDQLRSSTDIWSLGVILYESLTGKRPFRGELDESTHRAILYEQPLPPRELQDGIPRPIEELCLRCLNKEPELRPASALEIADALAEVSRPADRRTFLGMGVALGGLAAAAATAGWALVFRRPELPLDDRAKPGEIVSVLDRRPTVVGTPAPHRLDFDPAAPSFTVVSEVLVLLQLASTNHQTFEFEIGFTKAEWQGKAGIFWGLHDIIHRDRICKLANGVVFECLDEPGGKPQVRATAHQWRFEPLAPGVFERREVGKVDRPLLLPHYVRIKLPDSRVQDIGTIRLRILPNGTAEIEWQRRFVSWNAQFSSEHRGGLGFVNQGGESNVVRADFLVPISSAANEETK